MMTSPLRLDTLYTFM